MSKKKRGSASTRISVPNFGGGGKRGKKRGKRSSGWLFGK